MIVIVDKVSTWNRNKQEWALMQKLYTKAVTGWPIDQIRIADDTKATQENSSLVLDDPFEGVFYDVYLLPARNHSDLRQYEDEPYVVVVLGA